MRRNKLNDLDSKTWLRFQKSWFIHNPPPRKKNALIHPAKFPETLAQEFIEFFTKPGQTVLDPMVGTGSALIACLRSGRTGIGIELNPKYAQIAQNLIEGEMVALRAKKKRAKLAQITVIQGDAAHLAEYDLPAIDYVITSPPYWDMLRMRGAETQKKRRTSNLDQFYSDDPADLGNISDYTEFVARLCRVYEGLQGILRDGAYMTIIVKNVKKGGRMYPLAWDLASKLRESFTLKDEKIWVQDNQRLAPYGLGSAWVSNTFHHYCLNFRKE
ncbi:MAG TPA: DNA methyltransferase [Anaerolineae bacterium]